MPIEVLKGGLRLGRKRIGGEWRRLDPGKPPDDQAVLEEVKHPGEVDVAEIIAVAKTDHEVVIALSDGVRYWPQGEPLVGAAINESPWRSQLRWEDYKKSDGRKPGIADTIVVIASFMARERIP